MKRQLPPPFVDRLAEMFGQSFIPTIEKTFIERPTTFRVNTLKAGRNEVLEILQQEGFKIRRVPWYGDAFILENKKLGELQKLSLYQEGKIYVQSLASMVPPLVLEPKSGEKVLDLTAAPGSKTSQMAALMKNEGELVGNDNDQVRFQKLDHNLRLLGVTCATLKRSDGWKLTDTYKSYFDRVLLDAPCTAEARIILAEPRTYSFLKEKNIKEHAFVQRKLLFAAWEMLKPGGTLVYSTCTFAPEENEVQIARFVNDLKNDVEVLPIDLPQLARGPIVKEWRGEKTGLLVQKTVRILPNKDIEGFYIAKLRKKG